LRIDNDRVSQLAKAEEREVSLEKEKAALQVALTIAHARAKKNAEALEVACKDALAAEEANIMAEGAQNIAEDKRSRWREIIQRWRNAISLGSDAVQADLHG
jgi:hypothetical protein